MRDTVHHRCSTNLAGRAMALDNFQCQGVLLIRIIVGKEPVVLAVIAGGACLDVFLSPTILPFFLGSI